MRWRAVSGWPPSPKAAASRAGCIGVGPVPSSSGKPSMNGRPARFGLVSGRGNIMTGNATRATAIKRRFDPWPINGYASTSAAGEIGWPTPRSATWKRGALAPPRRTRKLTWWPVQNRVWAAASGHREERFRRGRPPEVSDDYRNQEARLQHHGREDRARHHVCERVLDVRQEVVDRGQEGEDREQGD